MTSVSSGSNNFISLISEHPFFSEPDGEITRQALESWINQKISEQGFTELSSTEIENLLFRCEEMEIINIKQYERGSIITPTKKIKNFSLNYIPVVKENESVIKSIYTVSQTGFVGDPIAQMLLENVKKFPDTYETTVYLPFFFILASNLINDRYTDWHTKLMLSASLGYIMLQEDIIPDYHQDGYIDDLYILAYSLREIMLHNSPHVIQNGWDFQEDIFSLIETVYVNSGEKIGEKTNLVLHKIGLKKFKNLEMIKYNSGVFQTINVIRAEKSSLIKLLVRILKIAHSECEKSDINKIMRMIQESPDYDEIKKEVFSTGIMPDDTKPTWKTIIEYLKEHKKN